MFVRSILFAGAAALSSGIALDVHAATVTDVISFSNIGIYQDAQVSNFWDGSAQVSGQFTLTYNSNPNVYTAPTTIGISNVNLTVPLVGQSGTSPYGSQFWYSKAYGVIEVGNTFVNGQPYDPLHPPGYGPAQNFAGQSDFILS